MICKAGRVIKRVKLTRNAEQDDPTSYIHRVGRTARASSAGRSLLFLQPFEMGFLQHLKETRVPLIEYEFPRNKILRIQPQLEKLIGQNYYLNKAAKEAYPSFINAYASHSLRSVFDVQALDLVKVAKEFGFSVPPRVDITVGSNIAKGRRVYGRRAYRSQPKAKSR